MCLAVPYRIEKLLSENRALARAGNVTKEIDISFVGVKPGDYVMVHAGFAIQKVDTQQAEEILKFIEKL